MNALQYFLFPHTVLPESDYRLLSILFPQLHILQIARQPQIPEWGQSFFSATPTISEEQRERVRILLKEYQNFADLVGEGVVLASMSRFDNKAAWRESRFHIQSAIKGKDEGKGFEDSQLALLEAAAFMEMAHNLDLQGLELEEGMTKVENLEREFRNILGIANEEDLEEFESIGDAPLISEKTYMSFMLPKRIAFWLRLFSCSTIDGIPVLVTVFPEVVEEIFDPLVSIEKPIEDYPQGFAAITLASIPSLEHLEADRFQIVVEELKQSGILDNYWRALEAFLANPKNSSSIEELSGNCDLLRSRLEAHDKGSGGSYPQTELSLALIENQTIQDLWNRFDKDGAGKAKGIDKSMQGKAVVLFLRKIENS